MSRHTKTLITTGLLALVLGVVRLEGWTALVAVQTAHAVGAPLTASGGFITGFSFIASILITIMNTFTWFLFMLLDVVLNPVWIFDLNSGPSLTNMLREIWQLCRDLVNLALALVLIAGAVMMIITSDSSKVKAGLPKFVMALILVNFSWFIPRAIFDVSQILTYTVYQIPSLLNADGCVLPATTTQPARPCEIVINYAFFRQTSFIRANGTQVNGAGAVVSTGWRCVLRPLVCIQTVPVGSPQATANMQMHSNVMNGLIVNHARLQTLVRISDPRGAGIGPAPGGGLNQIGASIMFLVKIVVILVFHAALFFPLLAMVAAFFIRIPILWVTMAFMPLTALSYVIQMPSEFDPKTLFQKQFLDAVFLPTKVAIPFTIGFIMVNAGASAAPPGPMAQALPIAIFSGVSSLWQIMWMIIALFIIWKYSFDTLSKGGEFVAPIAQKIKGYGDSTMQLGKAAITNAPIIPIPGAGSASLANIGRAIDPNTGLAQIRSGRPLQSFMQNLNEEIARRAASGGGGSATQQQNRAAEAVRRDLNVNIAARDEVRLHIDTVGAAGTDDATRLSRLGDALTRIRAVGGDRVRGISDENLIQGYLRENGAGIDEPTRKRILDTIRRRPLGGAGTT